MILAQPPLSAKAVEGGITRLTLSSFRNYDEAFLETACHSVVITGANGAGKTNLLEALSLLSPGRGLRRARLSDMTNQHTNQPWAVAARVSSGSGDFQLGTGLVLGERREVRLQGEPLKSPADLAYYLSFSWLTPAMDRLFLEGASERRRFLDRLVYTLDPLHAKRVTRYEQALRERAKLLKEGVVEPQWLSALEDILATEGVAITAARREMVGNLNHLLAETIGPFPTAVLSLDSVLADKLAAVTALETEDWLRQQYQSSRRLDASAGSTVLGAHRCDLCVFMPLKNMWAPYCSTGEQKALLLSIFLASARLQVLQRKALHVILLDEVAAHLDPKRREAFLEILLSLSLQVWMTGTEISMFHTLKGKAQHLFVDQGHVINHDF